MGASSSSTSRGSVERSSSTLANHNYPASRNRMHAVSSATNSITPSTAVAATAAAAPSVTTPNTIISRPGAYAISREGAGPTQVYRVQIPAEVRPGQEFQVICGSRTVRVRCPIESRSGHYLQITVPPDPIVRPRNAEGRAILTSAIPGVEGGGAVRMSEVVARGNAIAQQLLLQQQQQGRNSMGTSDATQQQQQQPASPTTYMVTVPPGISPGMQFAVDVEGERMSEYFLFSYMISLKHCSSRIPSSFH